jgi:ubiquinone/menaquinone biosynthesis C-methylase UbiE
MAAPQRGERYVSHAQARRIYDLIGRRQDSRLFSERRALDELAKRGSFGGARAVFEFGCGTGRFAARLLRTRLPDDCLYAAVDVSPKMVALARRALADWPERAFIDLTDGSTRLWPADGEFDRFVCTYVIDLLSPDDTETLLGEAHRILGPGGLLCLASLTFGAAPLARLLTSLWRRAWEMRPWLVGGCRPVELTRTLSAPIWTIRYVTTLNVYALSSELLMAERL